MQDDFLRVSPEALGLDVNDNMSAEIRNKIMVQNKDVLIALPGSFFIPHIWP